MKEFELENNKEKNRFIKEMERIKDKKNLDELKHQQEIEKIKKFHN